MARQSLTESRLRQSGIALVMVLVIVAIVSLITVELSMGQQMWLSHAQNMNDRTQAEWVRRGAEEYASMMLDRDRQDNNTDDLDEIWASSLPPFPAEGGVVAIAIEDLQGRFNINSLVKNGQYNAESGAVFRRLLVNAGIQNDIQDAVLDWIDSDSIARANGAEDDFYTANEKGYRTPNQLLVNVRELALIRGIQLDDLEKLSGLVVALPQSTPININTAPAPVLAALFEGMSVQEAKQIVDYRKKTPFRSTADIMKAVSGSYAPPKGTLVSVGSQYFKVATAIEFGRYSQLAEAQLYRSNDAKGTYFFYHGRPLIRIDKEPEQ